MHAVISVVGGQVLVVVVETSGGAGRIMMMPYQT